MEPLVLLGLGFINCKGIESLNRWCVPFPNLLDIIELVSQC